MTKDEMKQFYDKLAEEEKTLLFNKNKEYTRGDDDALFNFKEIATEVKITSYRVWFVLFKKHYNSLVHWLNDGEMSSGESIESRLKDLRNYLFILNCLYKDNQKRGE